MTSPDGPGRFPTTNWTLIARIRSGDEAVARAALDEVCAQYRFPLYCYIRRHSLAHHDAEDALHDFLAKLLRLDAFADASEDRGRLRTFLSHALGRFLINWRRDRPHRDFELGEADADPDTGDEVRYLRAIAEGDTPERLFDRKWGHTLLARAIARLRARYAEKGQSPLFDALLPALNAGGTLGGNEARIIAATLGVKENALRVALTRLMARFRTAFEDEVMQTVASTEEMREEVAHLMRLFGA
jgi:RNA polymerase sigma-70 factor (ECF subfamily)